MSNKEVITVLGHQIEYDTENVVIDDGAEQTLHDMIYDAIDDEETSGTIELHLEDEQEREIIVMVKWKIVNPAADKWKSIAGDLAYDLQQNNERGYVSVENYEAALKQEAIKEQ